jgi:hypothetical protein
MKKRGRTRKMKKKRVGTVKSRMCGFFQKGVFRSFGVGSGIVCEGNIILGVETHHTKNHSCPKQRSHRRDAKDAWFDKVSPELVEGLTMIGLSRSP